MAFRGGRREGSGEGGASEFDAERGNSIIREARSWHASGSTKRGLFPPRFVQRDRRTIPKSPRGKWSVP